jgi:hypothetical protein
MLPQKAISYQFSYQCKNDPRVDLFHSRKMVARLQAWWRFMAGQRRRR